MLHFSVNILFINCTGISKYLRHSEAFSAKHYDFGTVEESARNHAAVVNLMGTDDVPEIETESNSTIENDDQPMTDAERTAEAFRHLIR